MAKKEDSSTHEYTFDSVSDPNAEGNLWYTLFQGKYDVDEGVSDGLGPLLDDGEFLEVASTDSASFRTGKDERQQKRFAAFEVPPFLRRENDEIEMEMKMAMGIGIQRNVGLNVAAMEGASVESAGSVFPERGGVDNLERASKETGSFRAAGSKELEVASTRSQKIHKENAEDLYKQIMGIVELKKQTDDVGQVAAVERDLIEAENAAVVRSIASKNSVLVKGPAGQHSLWRATLFGRTDVVMALLEAGVSPNGLHTRLPSGMTPLHVAALQGSDSIVQALVGAGADMNILVKERTPLHLAAGKGHKECVHTLLTAGADYTIGDEKGHYPLCHAFVADHTSLVDSMCAFMFDDMDRLCTDEILLGTLCGHEILLDRLCRDETSSAIR